MDRSFFCVGAMTCRRLILYQDDACMKSKAPLRRLIPYSR